MDLGLKSVLNAAKPFYDSGMAKSRYIKPEKTIKRFDQSLLLAVLFLMGLGLVQVYSSSYIFAMDRFGDGLFFIKKQLLYTVLGLMAIIFGYLLPWDKVKKYGWVIWLLAVVGLTLTLVPSLMIKAGGAARWVRLPFGQRFEPAELLKYSFPFVTAYFLCYGRDRFKTVSPYLWTLVTFFPFVFLMKQPDFGTMVICGSVLVVTLFCYGLKWRYLLLGFCSAIPGFFFFVWNVPYRKARIEAFLDPWVDPSAKGFQVIQSMLSFHSGGVWGAGLGQGQSKLFFLPEAHTDFIFSVFAEEMGLIGVLVVISIYAFVAFKGFQITARCEDQFSQAVSLGITTTLSLSVFINLGVVMGMLPTKGLTLPFMSYGGSSLLSTCLACGILLNIGRENVRMVVPKSFRGFKI